MPSRRHSSAIFSSPRKPSNTTRTFSSAEYFLRVLRRISRTVASTAALVSSLMVYSLASLILTRNSHLSFSPYFVSQVLKRNTHHHVGIPLQFGHDGSVTYLLQVSSCLYQVAQL